MGIQRELFNSVTSEKLEKFRGSLAFSAVGDALGWPVEFGWYPGEVEKRFGRRYLEDYVSWEKLVGGKFWGYRETIEEGQYSDDTQLTLAIYRCIDENGDFIPDKFAYFELPLWLHYERGGGKTIKASARKLTQSSKEWMNNFYATRDLSYRNAGANGAAMRVLPIALVNISNEERLYRDAFMNSIITHGHPRAILGSIIYAAAVRLLVNGARMSSKVLLQYLHDTINNFSKSFKGDDSVQRWVQEWDKKPLNGMQFREVFQKTQNEAIGYLRGIEEKINSEDEEFYRLTKALSSYKGSGISTVLVAIYLFVKYLDAPQKAILKAVNMLGSDTDSIAAFVGGLFGAYYGISAIPSSLLDRLQDKDYILRTAGDLYDIATDGSTREYASSKIFERYDVCLKIMAWELGLREIFWEALEEGNAVVHPALGRGIIKRKEKKDLIRRESHIAKLIQIDFDCGQSCVFHSRVSVKDGELSVSLVNEIKKVLDLLEKGRIATSLLGQIEDIYEISTTRRTEIERFLTKHKYLFPILEEAEQQIFSIFGDNVRLCLELHRDPEEGWDELFIIIKSEYSAEEAFRLENRLAEEWFLDRMKNTKGKLNIIEEPLSL